MNYSLVTGASGGLGKAFCKLLATLNKNLILTGRSREKLLELESELRELNSNIKILIKECDLTSDSSRNCLFSLIESMNIKIEGLYNIAGVDTQKEFTKYSQEKLIFQTRALFEGTVAVTLFALNNRADKLEILTVSSMCGKMPIPYFAIYSSLKGAIVSFFDSLRYETKKQNVVITTVLPGSIPTREDIILDIEKQGLTGRLSKKSPEYVANKSIFALSKRKKNFVPGFYNKLVSFINAVTPKFIKINFMAKKFRNKEKDAF